MDRYVSVEILRPRILDVFARSGDAPVRMLCAANGGGKTTALRQYAAGTPDVGIITLPPLATRAWVQDRLARLDGATLTIVDQADVASPSGYAALFEDIEAKWTSGKRYLLSGSSRTRMRVQSLVARGNAMLFEPSLLTFTSDEIRDLANAHGVAAGEMDVEQLQYDTDGWPVAVAWVIRDAARYGRSLRGAFELWREHNGHLLLELVTLAQSDAGSAAAFTAAISAVSDPASQRALDQLDALGYPVVRMRTGLRPYRVFMPAAGERTDAAAGGRANDRLVLKLFGRFSCTIAQTTVKFARRRDQNLLTYLALSPGGTVPRAELLLAFWPDSPPATASQGLRTTLCRLRHAIAAAAGCDAERYLRVDGSIALNLDRVSIDVRMFRNHVERGALEASAGNRDAAREHFQAAERLYADTLLSSEACEPVLESYAEEYSEMFETVLVALVQMCLEDSDIAQGQCYERRRTLLSVAARERRAVPRLQSTTGTNRTA